MNPSAAPFGWSRAAAAGLTFRPIAEADLPFLARLYASTRTEELAAAPWSVEQKAAFLNMQFQAQHTHYQSGIRFFAANSTIVARLVTCSASSDTMSASA